MNGSRTNRTNSSKPVNINISFTINPKNILNQPAFGVDNQIKSKKISGSIQMQSNLDKNSNILKLKAPDLSNTERVDLHKDPFTQLEDKKYKKSRKRNSVDQSYLNEFKRLQPEKSVSFHKQGQSMHIRKSSTKSKKPESSSIKRKHNKTYSKVSAIDGVTFRQNNLGSADQKSRNFRSIINRLITNQLSKRSLPISLPTQQNKTARKKKLGRKKQLREGHSQHLIKRQQKDELNYDQINRKVLIQKLTSLRSMNNSIFRSQEDQQIKIKQRRTIVINTDHSIDCIDEIHEMQKAATKLRNIKDRPSQKQKVNDTKTIIENYISFLKSQEQQIKHLHSRYINDQNIEQQFQKYRRQHQILQKSQDSKRRSQDYGHNLSSPEKEDVEQKDKANQLSHVQNDKQLERYRQLERQKQQKNSLRQFRSSQMTKQQKVINQIERVKLNQLKKHEVEKWGQLLNYIKQSLKQGKSNHDQILNDIYCFLQQTKNDLQKQISSSKQPQQKVQKDKLQQFTNKFPSNQLNTAKKEVERSSVQKQQKQFNQISSMSYKDEYYQEQNQQLKLMNLQMIQNALKSRHENLLEKKEKQISNLQDQKINGLLSEQQFMLQKERIEKWTKKQTGQIMQARKNIWKGYNEAKNIIQKSLKSKYFQQQSAKKKSMMKCLSQDYLLKSYNYKKLLKPQIQSQSQEEFQNLGVKKKESYEESNQEGYQNQQQQQHDQQSQNQTTKKKTKVNQEDVIINKRPKQNDKQDFKNRQFEYETPKISSEQDVQNSEQKQDDQQQQHRTLKHDKQLNQLRELGEFDDMEAIKQKLQNMKNKHLPQESKYDNSDDEAENEPNISKNNSEISYEEVDNQLHESISDNEIKLINQELEKQKKQPSEQVKIQKQQKLKHILPQDKQDIFQFIFLDLSIELYQQPCHLNKIMDSINNYVAYMKRQANKKKGVKTNLNVVKEYLKRFLGFILRAHKNILKTLDEPVGPTAIEMLRYMHENDDQPVEAEEPPSPLVIPTSIFDLFEKTLLPSIQFQPYYENDEERETKRIQFLKNILHIHNKALFDAMNQYLDLLRPFGIWGKPFPWKNSSSFFHLTTQQQKQQKLKKASEKVVQYCSYVCGLLVDKQESLVGNAKLSEEYIDQIKQDRLSRMLATQLMQNQERWLFYDDQETEVLVQIANSIYVILMKQATVEANQIIRRKVN